MIPVLLNHDQKAVIGYMVMSADDHLIVHFDLDQRMTRETIKEIFGGACFIIRRQIFEAAGPYIEEIEILEWSLVL